MSRRNRRNTANLTVIKDGTNQYENDRRYLTPGEAMMVNVHRVAEGGFQRTINENRVKDIEKDLEARKAKGRESNYPEVVIANVSGKLYCIDGQHRLEAHIRAGMNCPVHVESMSMGEAIDRFVRDNGKAKALRRPELVAAARNEISKQLRTLCKTYGCTIPQAISVACGLVGRLPNLQNPDATLADPEANALGAIMEIWTKDARFVQVDAELVKGSSSTKERQKFRKSVDFAFSNSTTMYALGCIAKESVTNLTKLRKDIRIIRDADWTRALQHSSLRGLARDSKRKELAEFMRMNVLLPYYRDNA